MTFSEFGDKFTGSLGILQLMDDLGNALAADADMRMLGGGNPSHIPAVQAYFQSKMGQLLDDGAAFNRMIGDYSGPQGMQAFVEALADFFNQSCGWDVGPQNIALTNGSQSAFFFLFNMLGGRYADGSHKKILLPLTPEYIGYTDLGLDPNLFVANKPEIDILDEHIFKYRLNFDTLQLSDEIGALCVSRPTNPTGNVLTNIEIERLDQLAQAHQIPLIIDNAYGTPFPNIIFTDAQPVWNENTILCMSLSKLGLPGARTGIVIANEAVIGAITGMNAVFSLAPGGIGATLALDLIKSGEILDLSQMVIKPYYQKKAVQAKSWLLEALDGVDFYIHKPEGALFLWLWFKNIPIHSQTLYERLKARGVLIVPGHHFFPGLAEEWPHRYQCLRMTYCQDDHIVQEAIEIMGQVIKEAYAL